MVYETILESKETTAEAFVDRAAKMAADLENERNGSSATLPIARKRAAHAAGIPASMFYSLRYQRPKTIAANIYYRLCIAVERRASEKIGELQHEIAVSRARGASVDNRAICKAETCLAKARELLKTGTDK